MMKAVLFDFDGTLIDTHSLNLQGLNHVSLESRGIPFDDCQFAEAIGKPLDSFIQSFCPNDSKRVTESFQNWYRKHHNHYARPYEDVEDMLFILKSEGYQIGIVTNNSRLGLMMGLDLLGLESFFDVIITRDDVTECKPSPEGILKALKELHLSADACMFVGDTEIDIQAARAANVMPVLVGWTTLTLEQTRVLAPAELIESPYEIPFLLNLLNAEIA